jgi:hypothetical protein
MIKYFIIFNILIIPRLTLNANVHGRDSIVVFNEISFHNKYEEQVLNQYFSTDTADFLKLFLATSDKIDYTEIDNYIANFNNFYENFNSRKFLKAKPKKKMRMIYRSVHNSFFSKYELITTFDNIFKTGEYNCVTASALYGIILDKLNIPFFAVETPVHVYIVSYPGRNRIKIESTGPYAGFFVYSQSLKRAYIENFKDYNFIDEKEYSRSSLDELFDKYFFIGNKISLEELVGIQYFNIAAYNILDNKIVDGYNSLEKAYIFYPSRGTRILLFNYLNHMIPDLDYDNFNHLNYLIKLTRFSYQQYIREVIKSEFVRITEEYLTNESDPEYYDSIYLYLSDKIKDDIYIKDIEFIYNYEKGRFLINNGFAVEGHNMLSKALELKSENILVLETFIQSLKVLLQQTDTIEAIEKLEGYRGEYPQLSDAATFNKLLMRSYLKGAYNSFKTKDIIKGDHYLDKFEDLYKINTEIEPDEYWIGEAYFAASVHFFRKGYYAKAKEYLSRGLNYAPESKSLKIGISSF